MLDQEPDNILDTVQHRSKDVRGDTVNFDVRPLEGGGQPISSYRVSFSCQCRLCCLNVTAESAGDSPGLAGSGSTLKCVISRNRDHSDLSLSAIGFAGLNCGKICPHNLTLGIPEETATKKR